MMNIEFKPINVRANFETCLAFRKEAYLCTFGTTDGFDEQFAGYKQRMKTRRRSKDWFYIHLWHGSDIIGQLEFRNFSNYEGLGYLHLIYIREQFRGKGVADLAQLFLEKTLKKQGCTGVMLSVGRSNLRALKHYKKFDWQHFGNNPKHELTDFYVRRFDRQ